MTIPSSNWCNDCEEECTGHVRVCTMCGGALTAPASNTTNTAAAPAPPSFRAMPALEDFLPPEMQTNDILRTVRQQVQATTALARNANATAATNAATRAAAAGNGGGGGGEDNWQAIPAALLDPQASTTSGKTPTSEKVLKNLPREKLHPKSASFFRVTLEITTTPTTTPNDGSASTKKKIYEDRCLTTGEVGPLPSLKGDSSDTYSSFSIQGPLWTPSTRNQRTGKESWPADDKDSDNTAPLTSCIALLERGHGISFYQKSLQAQQAGAIAVLIINDRQEPWPYAMKDSRSPAVQHANPDVTIPVVMISLDQGQTLLQECLSISSSTTPSIQAHLVLHHNNSNNSTKTCVVCRDSLELGQTSLTLTNYCGHTFHESCALQWLQHHNSCPTCRRTLPTTEGSEEEQERRRLETSSSNNGGEHANTAFYS